MQEQIFQITMKVPLGERRGQLRWKERDGLLEGFIEIMGNKNPFTGKVLSEGTVKIEGTLVTAIRNIPFTAEGNIEGRMLLMALTEARRTYSVKGVEITNNEEIL